MLEMPGCVNSELQEEENIEAGRNAESALLPTVNAIVPIPGISRNIIEQEATDPNNSYPAGPYETYMRHTVEGDELPLPPGSEKFCLDLENDSDYSFVTSHTDSQSEGLLSTSEEQRSNDAVWNSSSVKHQFPLQRSARKHESEVRAKRSPMSGAKIRICSRLPSTAVAMMEAWAQDNEDLSNIDPERGFGRERKRGSLVELARLAGLSHNQVKEWLRRWRSNKIKEALREQGVSPPKRRRLTKARFASVIVSKGDE